MDDTMDYEWGADYTIEDVNAAEARIRRECPDALVARTDYDWSLSVAKADRSKGFIVFRTSRPDRGRTCHIGDVGKIIAALKS